MLTLISILIGLGGCIAESNDRGRGFLHSIGAAGMVVSCAGGLPRRDVSSKEEAQSELEGDVNDSLNGHFALH